ncbi:hypothetical protein [Trinickia mobilis]|uniref:hypothetical protein n=1 Tax=Trinickia mobilis TaxID=2816356 RepID=UPI001A8D4F1F|nr:hypothetical protein [Trinickia mobilis]
MDRIGPFTWRAKAWQPKIFDAAPEPYVSEILGEVALERRKILPAHPSQRILLAVRQCIQAQMKYQQPLDPSALLCPFMTVIVDCIHSKGPARADESERIARVDLIVQQGVASAVAEVQGIGMVDLDETEVDDDDRAWEVFVRLLASVDVRDFREL